MRSRYSAYTLAQDRLPAAYLARIHPTRKTRSERRGDRHLAGLEDRPHRKPAVPTMRGAWSSSWRAIRSAARRIASTKPAGSSGRAANGSISTVRYTPLPNPDGSDPNSIALSPIGKPLKPYPVDLEALVLHLGQEDEGLLLWTSHDSRSQSSADHRLQAIGSWLVGSGSEVDQSRRRNRRGRSGISHRHRPSRLRAVRPSGAGRGH